MLRCGNRELGATIIELPDPSCRSRTLMILVVEDDEIQRQDIEAQLADAGYETISADNAEMALRLLNALRDIQMIVLDVRMPGSLDGIDVLLAVRARWPGIKTIMVSGQANPDQLPADTPLLTKPLSEEKFVATVRQLLTPTSAQDFPTGSGTVSAFGH